MSGRMPVHSSVTRGVRFVYELTSNEPQDKKEVFLSGVVECTARMNSESRRITASPIHVWGVLK